MTSPQRLWRGMILAFLAVIATAVPAAGGTAQDPELTDTCGDEPIVVQWADICSGWVEAVFEPAPGWPNGRRFVSLDFGFEMAGGMDSRPQTAVHEFGWFYGICNQWLRLSYVAARASWLAELRTNCENILIQTIPLPADKVTVTATGVRFSLGHAELSQLQPSPGMGSRLQLWANTGITARLTDAHDQVFYWDTADAQRHYDVPQG